MRPKDADSEATLERILSSARTLLDADGPAGLSLRGVARHANLSVGTVSYYFSSLEDLSEACLDEHYDRMRDVAAGHLSHLAAGTELGDVIEAAAKDLYRFAVSERALLRLQLATHAQRGGLLQRRREGHQHSLLRAVSEHLEPLTRVEHPWLKIQTLTYAVVRFATASPEERLLFTGAKNDEDAHTIIANHVAELARNLLLVC